MRRIVTALALVAACSLGVSVARAGVGSCSKKAAAQKTKLAKAACSAKQACAAADAFPTIVRLVGDKTVGCPQTAEKLAKETGKKVIYLIGDKKFDCPQEAMKVLADVSEAYSKRFLTIACVVDGKVIYCDERCGNGASCGGAKAKLSKAGGKACYKAGAKKAKLASAGDKACSKTCTKAAKLAADKGKTCSKTCTAKTAAAKGKTCPMAAAKLAKAGGKACCKAGAKKAKLASADGKACSKTCTKAAKLAKADGKDCSKTCPFAAAKLAKASDKACPHPVPSTKLTSTDGKACSKAGAKTAKLAKTGGKSGYHAGYEVGYAAGYAAAMKDSLVKAHGQSWSRQGKTVKYRVAGRDLDTWADAVKARDRAVAAVKKVNMRFIVDGKELGCSSQVCPKAKAAGKVQFVVAGKKMQCEFCARAALAKAQYEAARAACSELLAQK